MNRLQKLTRFVAATIFIAALSVAATAQTLAVGGRVFLKQADGTNALLPGALIKIYRVDIKQEFQTKSDKKGQYIYAGLPYVGVYTIVISAPGARPQYFSNIKMSSLPPEMLTKYDITMEPGDGSTLTLDQVKSLEAAGGSAPAAPANAPPSAEAKKKADELAAERAKIENENKRAGEINAKLPEIMKTGNEAFSAGLNLKDPTAKIQKYDEAISNYDQALALDTDQPNFLRNKSIVLLQRGKEKYNVALVTKNKDGKEAAKNDFKAAAETSELAIAAQRKLKSAAPAGTTGGAGQNNELDFLSTRFDAYRLSLQTSTQIDNDAAAKAIEEYINAETDQAKKDKAQSSLGDALFFAGRVDDSIAKFREILAKNPNNLDAMFGLGISLAAKVTDATKDAALLTEAHDMLQQFVAKAPEGYPRKQDAAESVKYLEETISANKITEKSNKSGTTRRKP
jgi:tetratricopeptide (TPR) repeat protein